MNQTLQDRDESFRAYIRFNPNDRGAIDAYADWLEEQGDDRCYFLRGNRFCPHCLTQSPIWESAMIWQEGEWRCPTKVWANAIWDRIPEVSWQSMELPAIHRDFAFTARDLAADRAQRDAQLERFNFTATPPVTLNPPRQPDPRDPCPVGEQVEAGQGGMMVLWAGGPRDVYDVIQFPDEEGSGGIRDPENGDHYLVQFNMPNPRAVLNDHGMVDELGKFWAWDCPQSPLSGRVMVDYGDGMFLIQLNSGERVRAFVGDDDPPPEHTNAWREYRRERGI